MSYTAPTNATLIARYPDFTSVSTTTIDYWLNEALAEVDDSWPEDVRANGQMAWAAHRMAELGATGLVGVSGGSGVSSFKSGTFSATLTDEAANRTGYYATVYGREFADMQRRWFGGPRVY
jgi:hypothetical protein